MAEYFIAVDLDNSIQEETRTAYGSFTVYRCACTRDKRRIMFGARVRSSVGTVSCLVSAGDIVYVFLNSSANERQ